MIKRYEYLLSNWRIDFEEHEKGDWCRYADIAPLEAKAALFDEAIAVLEELLEFAQQTREFVSELFPNIPTPGNKLELLTSRTNDLLTRARAMEAK